MCPILITSASCISLAGRSRAGYAPTAFLTPCLFGPFFFFFFLPICLFLVQHFIQSNTMEDGQVAGQFAPDREVDDPTDFEFNGGHPIDPAGGSESSADNSDSEESDEDAESDSADDDADPPPAARGGMPTSSFEQFLAEWSDDDDDDDALSKIGGSTAAHPRPLKVPAKRAAAASSSSANAP